MNEYLIVFVAALLFFNLPKIFGYLIKGLGLRKIELTFSEYDGNESKDVSLFESKTVKSIPVKTKRNYLTKKKVGKLK